MTERRRDNSTLRHGKLRNLGQASVSWVLDTSPRVCVRCSECILLVRTQMHEYHACVCFYTLERLVVASPCLVHWGAAICSSNGRRSVWHCVQFMTLLSFSAITMSGLQAIHSVNQKRATHSTQAVLVFLPSSIIFGCFYTACGSIYPDNSRVQVRANRIIYLMQIFNVSV